LGEVRASITIPSKNTDDGARWQSLAANGLDVNAHGLAPASLDWPFGYAIHQDRATPNHLSIAAGTVAQSTRRARSTLARQHLELSGDCAVPGYFHKVGTAP
jgi:hypothetical protein